MKQKLLSKLLIIGIIFIAGFFRFYGINWDQGFHLHPDERFLTMVGLEMRQPQSFIEYLNPQQSPFNPSNIGFTFFVYGTFPLILTKLISLSTGYGDYNSFTILGRFLSATADLFVVVIIFKLVSLFELQYKFRSSIKFLAAGFYALSVLPIQLAHFFAVDSFLNLFLFTSFYFIVLFSQKKRYFFLILSALFLGLAFATKITAIFIIPLLILFVFPLKNISELKLLLKGTTLNKLFLLILLYGLVCYLTTRIADPYLFQNTNFLNLQPNQIYLQSLHELDGYNKPDAWFPPGVQWIHKTPILFALQNIAIFGLGIPLFLLVLVGSVVIGVVYRKTKLIFLLLWCSLFFLYQSTQMIKTMRYFIILYPFFAIFAAFGFEVITKKNKSIFGIILVIILLLWPLSFINIYTHNHSRVIASEYIYHNLPNNSVILSEHWDDALPLPLLNQEKTFSIIEMPVFGPDDNQKWTQMQTLLDQGDYIILSSNRGWGSIPTVPERYPRMTQFYNDLFADRLPYKKIATFTSYPSFSYLGIPITISDDFAEEAFTVYDHPKIMIFKKIKNN